MCSSLSFFFFNDTATTEIYTLSLHDALPISLRLVRDGKSPHAARRAKRAAAHHPPGHRERERRGRGSVVGRLAGRRRSDRSEEHTSELQSRLHLVCRLLLEKKKAPVPSPLPG